MSGAEGTGRGLLPGRFLVSELALVFRRRRNQVLLGVLLLVPVLICVAVRLQGRGGGGGSIFGSITDNGLFAALAALLAAGPLFLPLVVAVVAGESVAGEAATGTLRYLLTVPAGRTRVLAVKFAALAVWTVTAVLVLAVTGVLAGLVAFPGGELTLLSGRTVGYGDGLLRLALVTGYVAVTLLLVAALGLFVSTLTEVPLAAMATTLTLTIVCQVADAIPQLAPVHGWLPTHYWTRWIDLLREPVVTDGMTTGLLVTLGYGLLFLSLAWARFGGKDITS